MHIEADESQLKKAYQRERSKTVQLCLPLAIEDYVIQSILDVSPPKWHLAHTTWFFETFVLIPYLKNYQPFHAHFHYLFNSYYQTIGNPYPRERRGLLARPTVETIYEYRQYVDEHILELLSQSSSSQTLCSLLTLGLNHEQQHQELLLMDIKHNFSLTPELSIYSNPVTTSAHFTSLEFISVTGGEISIGNQGETFCFDNELPRHKQILQDYALANRLTTNSEYLEFMLAGGYKKPELWLADGWEYIQKNNWQAPLYWHNNNNEWHLFTLQGLQKLNLSEPVVHVSFYEADAYSRWCGKRLPTEAEWEHFVLQQNLHTTQSNFLEKNILHPRSSDKRLPTQFFGDVWEWTQSAYHAYPGYKSVRGPLGEYNGKFMSNQIVLRGGSCVTPEAHIRSSYRNFYQPEKRWQFSGIRLAEDVGGK